MNRPLIKALASGSVLLFSACASRPPDSVERAETATEARHITVTDESAKFLIEQTDARLADYQEGKLGAERGTTPAIRAYGERMVRDQPILLTELQRLATQSNVAIPTTISADKRDGLHNLLEANLELFDTRFIAAMKIDHTRDVGAFHYEAQSTDPAIAEFAKRNIQLIESHLEGIEKIEREYVKKE